MANHDYVIANAPGATVRADLNDAFAAIVTRNSGTSAPATTYANMVWVDTTLHVVKERNEANSAWIVRGRTDAEGVLAKTALYTLAVRDFGKLIDATSGTWTLTLMAAATATDGFWFECRNSGTGVITIDGDSSETIDGLTTIEVHPGEFVRLQCNGTLWRSDRIRRLGSLPENIQTDTYSVLTSDRGKLCIANKATAMTFNLPAAATAGKGFLFFYKNIGAGTLTLDGDSAETIDGAATATVAQNASGVLECDGSNWRTLLTGGGAAAGWTLATAQQPSGAGSVAFTGIPAGVNAIDISIQNLTHSGTDNLLVQIGDSGGIETANYESASGVSSTYVASTAGFIVYFANSGYDMHGFISLRRVTGNIWSCSHAVGNNATPNTMSGGGSRITLDADLDRVTIETTGTNTLTATNINLMYQ